MKGLICHPHPETKPEQFQQSDLFELLFPHVDARACGDGLTLEIPAEEMKIEILSIG